MAGSRSRAGAPRLATGAAPARVGSPRGAPPASCRATSCATLARGREGLAASAAAPAQGVANQRRCHVTLKNPERMCSPGEHITARRGCPGGGRPKEGVGHRTDSSRPAAAASAPVGTTEAATGAPPRSAPRWCAPPQARSGSGTCSASCAPTPPATDDHAPSPARCPRSPRHLAPRRRSSAWAPRRADAASPRCRRSPHRTTT